MDLFNVQKLFLFKTKKKTFDQIQSYETFVPKMFHLLRTRIFSAKPFKSLASLIHIYLHSKNQSLILIHLWNFGNERVLNSDLTRAFFSYNLRDNFSQTCSFCWILKDHAYFHFTLCQTKIMTSFSQKVQKTLFWGHFYYCWSFFSKGNFS